ncbi:unnamed protein product [Adineta ricciae]|uniref:Uncharacterized protein n=1 Tax=Adineta ricciae TaxID=249248 RepID=A0A814G8E2_ADIRI|nr:unnamed protein product [Adineta ricciae]CAF0990371.1 unnamed protein product [Adineta ricciae]
MAKMIVIVVTYLLVITQHIWAAPNLPDLFKDDKLGFHVDSTSTLTQVFTTAWLTKAKRTEESCLVTGCPEGERFEFFDYDSVDKALLNKPHQIKSVYIDIEKGERHCSQPVTTEVLDLQRSAQKYRIRVTNLLEVASDFVKKWNGQFHDNLNIQRSNDIETTDLSYQSIQIISTMSTHTIKKTGYAIKLKTIKSAPRLFEECHERTLDEYNTLQCQLETNTFPSRRTCSCDSSCSSDSADSSIAAYQEPKSSNQSIFATNGWNCSSKLILASADLSNQWEIAKKLDKKGRVLLISDKLKRKQLVVFKRCVNNNELQALTIQEDIDNVSQLIDYSAKDDNRWTIIKRAPGLSLEEFIQRKGNHVLDILQAVQLAQKVLTIIKCIHS